MHDAGWTPAPNPRGYDEDLPGTLAALVRQCLYLHLVGRRPYRATGLLAILVAPVSKDRRRAALRQWATSS